MHPTTILIGIGLLACASGLWTLAGMRWRRVSVWTLTAAALGVAVLALGIAALGVAAGLRAYQVFTRETLIAQVHCASAGAPQRFLLRYQPVHGAPQEYALRGDEWVVDGLILQWHPRLMLLGLQTVQKPVRIGGRYAGVRDQTSRYPTAYDLNGGVDLTWRVLYALGRYWPGVEAVYGSSAYVPADPHVTYGIYAAASGYVIKLLPQH